MKYLVSDTQKLPNKYGKWYWYTDDACKTFQNDEHLVIYAGYVIGKETIDEVIARNPHELDKANGCYFVVILTKNTAKVVLDYFCSTKHWWRNNGRVEFTNAIYLMPLTKEDLDMKEIVRRLGCFTPEQIAYEPKETFERWETFVVDANHHTFHKADTSSMQKFYNTPEDARKMGGLYVSEKYVGGGAGSKDTGSTSQKGAGSDQFEQFEHTYDFVKTESPPMKQYDPQHCMTFFKDVYLLQPDFMITAVDDKVEIVRLHNTYEDLMDAMKSEPCFTDSAKLEEYIHNCFKDHADTIREYYKDKHIVTSLSEGIDSNTEACYFPGTTKVTYSFDPPNAPLDFKQDAVDYWKERGEDIIWDVLDIRKENMEKMAREYCIDPTCFYWDSAPSYWQIGKLEKKPDVIIYGQCGDQMFMHKAFFYYEYMFCQMMKRKDLTAKEKLEAFNEELKSFRNKFKVEDIKNWTAEDNERNCYSAADNILQVDKAKTWQDAFFDSKEEDLLKELEESNEDDWMHDFTKKQTPPLYNREVSVNCDALVTSIYCDKRIFFSVMNASKDIMVDNFKHCTIQKNILKKYHNFAFRTPTKDQVELDCVGMRMPMHTDVVRYCLQDHLPGA